MNVTFNNINKVENLPKFQKIKSYVNKRYNYKMKDCYNKHYYCGSDFIKINAIVDSSEGLHIDDLFSKIVKIFPKNYKITPLQYIKFRLCRDDRCGYLKRHNRLYEGLYIDSRGFIRMHYTIRCLYPKAYLIKLMRN
jgi:hypothetical protein